MFSRDNFSWSLFPVRYISFGGFPQVQSQNLLLADYQAAHALDIFTLSFSSGIGDSFLLFSTLSQGEHQRQC